MKKTLCLAAAFAGTVVVAQPVPRHADFVTTVYAGPHHEAVITPANRSMRTRLRALVRDPVNFAGHYVVGWVGCGGGCMFPMIVDARNGTEMRGQLPPSLTDCNEGRERETYHRPDSRLLIVAGKNAEGSDTACAARYYKEENGALFLIKVAPFIKR